MSALDIADTILAGMLDRLGLQIVTGVKAGLLIALLASAAILTISELRELRYRRAVMRRVSDLTAYPGR